MARKTTKKSAKKTTKKSARKTSGNSSGRGGSKSMKKSARKKSSSKSAGKGMKKTTKKQAKKTTRKSTRKTARRGTSTAADRRAASGRASGKTNRPGRSKVSRNDFGIPADEARDRAMAGEDLMHREGGGPRQARGAVVGNRESGAGAADSGPGSSSGGDVDTDFIGVGSGRGLSQAGPDNLRDIGLAETDGSSDEFASGPPARGDNQDSQRNTVRGSTVMPLDDEESQAI